VGPCALFGGKPVGAVCREQWSQVMGFVSENSQTIGRSPLVQLSRVMPEGTAVLAKIEGRNPACSVKCRLGAALVWDAESRGVLRPEIEIIEPTSGNTGVALAFVAASRGYKLTLCPRQ